jgi:hypothetical protein
MISSSLLPSFNYLRKKKFGRDIMKNAYFRASALVILLLGLGGLGCTNTGLVPSVKAASAQDLSLKKSRGQKPFTPATQEELANLLNMYFGPNGIMELMRTYTPNPKDPRAFDLFLVQIYRFVYQANAVGHFQSFYPIRSCLHPRITSCYKVQHLVEAAVAMLFAKYKTVAEAANILCFATIHDDPTNTTYTEKVRNTLDLVHQWLGRARMLSDLSDLTGRDVSVSQLQPEPTCGIKEVGIEPDSGPVILGNQVEFKAIVLAKDDQEIVDFPVTWKLPDGSMPTDNPISFQPTQQRIHTIYVTAQFPTRTASIELQDTAELVVFPSVTGNWTGIGTETWMDCQNPADDGTYSGEGTLTIPLQSLIGPEPDSSYFTGSLSGSGVLTDFEGTVTLAGELYGMAPYTEQETDPATGIVSVTTGITDFEGLVQGDQLTMEWTFQDTAGDTCHGSGQAAFTRN